jgi:hypothetical protein
MKLALLHQLPLETYPPATNALDEFARHEDLEVLAISSPPRSGRTLYKNPGVRIERPDFARPGDRMLRRWQRSMTWHWQAARLLKSFAPDVVWSVEPHSALAAGIHSQVLRGRSRLFIHHHEYYSPEDYRNRGNRLTRVCHAVERRWLYPHADWISQTNADRLHLFQQDHPEVDPAVLRILPNYPPAAWQATPRAMWSPGTQQPLKLVYVGSLSLRDTFIGPLVDWIRKQSESHVTLDIFAWNTDEETRRFLLESSGSTVRFHESGVDYHRLPELLSQFHAGVILYRCNTINFRYNETNKLFEYLACGLDVWYPPTMLGVRPHQRLHTAPRVLEVDFERLDALDVASVSRRDDLPVEPWTGSCETVLSQLLSAMRSSHAASASRH